MFHPKLSRPKCVRSAIVPAALLCVILSGCAELEPTAPESPRIALTNNLTFGRYFTAWSRFHSSGPIQTQVFGLDPRQERQYVDWYPDEAVLTFARSHPGRVYIIGDEPDQWCIAPYEYAGMYQNSVSKLRAVDPTARLSPAGFAEPNARCCPEDDKACYASMHAISYAERFYNAYVQRYGAPPPVDEWRFHDFGLRYGVGDVDGWWAAIDSAATWSVAHGANMVLGAWGFLGWREPIADYQEHMKQGMGRLLSDSRINGAVYWALESWAGEAHYLAHGDGSLTAEGQAYANPMTDVPTGVKIAGSADGSANLRWSNTTSAWGAEAEFWVQAPGSDTFVPLKTERVAELGAEQTPFVAFNIGDRVQGRVRYVNAVGQAAWSPFSNTVLLALTEPEADHRRGRGKSPLLCFWQLC
ncbi:MAG: hypothetical protein ACSLFK_05105 [Gemmatimonadaceae bacterium]